MTYDCDEAYRLNIRIVDINKESIHIGIKQDDGDVYMRLRDPLGNIVYGPILIPSSGNGYISTYAQALAGPKAINAANGYNSIKYIPSLPGDYYIEFNPTNATTINRVKRTFTYFDVTVVKNNSTAIEGRLWSKGWDF